MPFTPPPPPTSKFEKMLQTGVFQFCIVGARITNAFNMPRSVKNCSVKFPKGHTPNEKRAHFLDFYESEGAPCPPCSAAHAFYIYTYTLLLGPHKSVLKGCVSSVTAIVIISYQCTLYGEKTLG